MRKRSGAARAVAYCAATVGVLGILIDIAAGPMPPVIGLCAYASLFSQHAAPAPDRPHQSRSAGLPTVSQATWPVPTLAARAHEAKLRKAAHALRIVSAKLPAAHSVACAGYGVRVSPKIDVASVLHRLQC